MKKVLRPKHMQLVLPITTLLIFAAASSAADVDDLIRLHLEALGGERAVRAVATVLASGEIEIAGTELRGTIEARSARPCLSSSDVSLGFFTVRQGYDGEHIWMVDPNGNLQIRRDAGSTEYQRTICVLESLEYIFGGPGVRVTYAGRDTINGAPCEALSLEVDEGAPCRLFLDDSTHLMRRMEIQAPEGNMVHTYDDYRRVGGIMFPFVQRSELTSLGQIVEIRYAEVAPNALIDPASFVPPASSERDYRFVSGRGSATVPFEYRHRHIFLPVRIAERTEEVLFLVDSGASMTVIDSTIAAELGFPMGGIIPGAGAGGMANFHMISVPGLRLDDIELAEQRAVAFPVAGLVRQFEETEIGGILGYDFLSRFVTRIDYERCMITFFEPDSFAAHGGEAVVDAPLMHNIFSVPVGLDGARGGSFLLDTGATSSLVGRAFARTAGIIEGKPTFEIALRGAGGEERAALCRFDSLSIGTIVMPEPVLAITADARGFSALENVDGLIGNDVLERFTVTLDYRSQRVLLERNGRFDEPFFRDRSGLQIARKQDGRIMIVNVVPESPAARAGLRPGDVIVKIDRMRSENIKTLSEAITLFEGNEGSTYRIEIERSGGRHIRSLTLGRYL